MRLLGHLLCYRECLSQAYVMKYQVTVEDAPDEASIMRRIYPTILTALLSRQSRLSVMMRSDFWDISVDHEHYLSSVTNASLVLLLLLNWLQHGSCHLKLRHGNDFHFDQLGDNTHRPTLAILPDQFPTGGSRGRLLLCDPPYQDTLFLCHDS